MNQLQTLFQLGITFFLSQVSANSKLVILGTARMNLAEFVTMQDKSNREAKIHVLTSGGLECEAAIIVRFFFYSDGS